MSGGKVVSTMDFLLKVVGVILFTSFCHFRTGYSNSEAEADDINQPRSDPVQQSEDNLRQRTQWLHGTVDLINWIGDLFRQVAFNVTAVDPIQVTSSNVTIYNSTVTVASNSMPTGSSLSPCVGGLACPVHY